MSKSEVIARLGFPVDSGSNSFTYTKEYSENYPMLWVNFDDTGRVQEVYAKYYEYFDDKGVYGLSYDSTHSEFCWGSESLKTYFKKE